MHKPRSYKEMRRESLRNVALFSGCTDKELWKIAAITTEYRCPARQVLTVAGELGHEFFVIIRGRATVSRDGIVLGTLGPGSFFGELALLDGGKRTATVVADTDMLLLVLSRSEFRSLHFRILSVTERMLAELGQRLRRADEGWAARVETGTADVCQGRPLELNSQPDAVSLGGRTGNDANRPSAQPLSLYRAASRNHAE